MGTAYFSRGAAISDRTARIETALRAPNVTLHAYCTGARTPQSTRARNYIVTPRVFNLSDAPRPPPPPSLSTFALLSHPRAVVAFDAASTLPVLSNAATLPFSRRRKPAVFSRFLRPSPHEIADNDAPQNSDALARSIITS